ncbi:MAG: hypothetical protein WCB46_02620 [Methanoregula sp.]
MSKTENSLYVEKVRGRPQCELFLMKKVAGGMEALVYNTTPLNDCPPGRYDPMDAKVLAQKTRSDVVWKNPRRFWMMDNLTLSLAGESREIDGLEFNFVAKMQMPAGFDTSKDQSSQAYSPMKIHRVTKYEFLKSKPVFLLRSPDRHTWVMQTYTNHVDRSLEEANLPTLAQRLKLPEGWQFKAKVLDRNLTITTNGLANIVPDDLANMYQGCIDNVHNFDPW